MAYYLVVARVKPDRLPALRMNLERKKYAQMRPFGGSLTYSLNHARLREDGFATWEEEDYCSPPLAQERAAVLDEYFEDLRVTSVQRHEGWAQIRDLPPLFPELAE